MGKTIYDIFISYRRDGGGATAGRINDMLTADGYSVSYDVDTLREGRFDKQLLDRIEQCQDFILVVDKNCFVRTIDPATDKQDDWLWQELSFALKLKKNIIPVLLAGTDFPKCLPEDIDSVRKINGPKCVHEYFDEFYKRLRDDFLRAYPRLARSSSVGQKNMACLKLKADIDCIFYLDGEEHTHLKAGVIHKIPLAKGEYELMFISEENGNDRLEMEFEMPDVDKLQKVKLCDIRDARLKKEAEAKRTVEEKRLAEEKKGKEDTEARRIAEERRLAEERRKTEEKMLAEERRREAERNCREEEEWAKERTNRNDLGTEVTQAISINNQSNRHTAKGGEITPTKRETSKANNMPTKNLEPYNIEELYQDGLWYFTTGHNNKKAIDYLERAAIAGHVEAQNLLGLVLCKEKKYSQAMLWIKKSADQGDSSAQYNLGKLYYKGYLGKVDYFEALKWFLEAANNSNDEANNMLGVLYEEGKGVTQNYNTAYDYYLIAAKAGNAAAQYNIGCLIAYNKITHYKLSKTDAIKWFELAVKQGDKDAEAELKKLRRYM